MVDLSPNICFVLRVLVTATKNGAWRAWCVNTYEHFTTKNTQRENTKKKHASKFRRVFQCLKAFSSVLKLKFHQTICYPCPSNVRFVCSLQRYTIAYHNYDRICHFISFHFKSTVPLNSKCSNETFWQSYLIHFVILWQQWLTFIHVPCSSLNLYKCNVNSKSQNHKLCQ